MWGVFLLHLLIAWTCASPSSASNQELLSASNLDPVERDAFYIFNAVHHQLRQWGNTLSPNGLSYTRGTIPIYTTLYHARGDEKTPPSPEWLAFDPEMSYGIMVYTCRPFLRTYQTLRDLNILYLDGNSASLTNIGTLDTQDILYFGNATNIPRNGLWDEVGRIQRLCAWGAKYNIDGFVRQNSGFELVKCDFEAGLKLIRNLPVGLHSRRIMRNSTYSDFPCLEHGPGRFDANSSIIASDLTSAQATPGRPYGPAYRFHPYYAFQTFQWIRSAVSVYDGLGEFRIKLDLGTFVTGYGRAGLELGGETNTVYHRAAKLHSYAALELKRDVEALYDRNITISGVDWRSVTDRIILRYGERLPELRAYLFNATNSTDATTIRKTLSDSRMLLSSILVSHYDFDASVSANVDICTHEYTTFAPGLDWSAEELKLVRAIEYVMGSICNALVPMYETLDRTMTSGSPLLNSTPMLSSITTLMAQLDWKMWIKCSRACGVGEVCLIGLWPLSGWDLRVTPEPKCASQLTWKASN